MKRTANVRDQIIEWLALAANIGVLLGLVLVILQLRQNAAMQRAERRHELAATIVELLHSEAVNPQFASVLRRAAVGEQLTPDELFQFRLRSNALLRYWEDVHYQYREGLYDESEFDSHRAAWRDSFAHSAALRDYWCEVRSLYSVKFAAEIIALLERPCGPPIARQPG